MAWQFEIWKEFLRTRGRKVTVLIIAGAIGASPLLWWQRPPHGYMTTRDYAEIVGKLAECALAMVDGVDDDDRETPLYMTKGWWGEFPSTNGAFTTNAIARYMDDGLGDALDFFADQMALKTRRKWADLWDAGGVVAAYGAGGSWDFYTRYTTGPIFEASVDLADYGHYVSTNWLNVVARGLSRLRWTRDKGTRTYRSFNVAGLAWPGSWRFYACRWRGSATGAYDAPWGDLVAAAFADLRSDSSYGYEEYLDYQRLVLHTMTITLTQDWDDERRVELDEEVKGTVMGTVTVGTNYTAWSTGRPYLPDGGAQSVLFYHPRLSAEPSAPVVEMCLPGVPAASAGSTDVVENVFLVFNRVMGWDGQFPLEAVSNATPWAFSPPTTKLSSTNVIFGWEGNVFNNAVIVFDWNFAHLTNRATFWE